MTLNYDGLWLRIWLPENKISRLETKATFSDDPPCRDLDDETESAASQRALSYLADRVNKRKEDHARCRKESQWFSWRALQVHPPQQPGVSCLSRAFPSGFTPGELFGRDTVRIADSYGSASYRTPKMLPPEKLR